MPTSLVTGAAGFAGQHLVRELLRAGHAVVGATLDGSPPVGRAAVLEPSERGRVRWVPLDVTSPEQVRSALREERFDQVFHLAGQASVGLSFSDVVGTWTANATGTLLLLRGLAERVPAARVLVVSSSEVYGAVPADEQPIGEARCFAPRSPYAASKAAAELVASQARASDGMHVVIARSFTHTGPGQSPSFALPNWAQQLGAIGRGAAEPVLRVGNLEAKRDLLDVRDVVRAYLLLGERGEAAGAYNVCSGEAHRLRDVVETMLELSGTGARIEVDEVRLRPVDVPLLCGDPGRLQGLGWRPRIGLRQTLVDLLAAAAGAS